MDEDNRQSGDRFNPFPKGTRNAMSIDSSSVVGLVLATLLSVLSLTDAARREETILWYLTGLVCAAAWTLILRRRYRAERAKGEPPAQIWQQTLAEGLETGAALMAMPVIMTMYILQGMPQDQELPPRWQLGTILNTSLTFTIILITAVQLKIWF